MYQKCSQYFDPHLNNASPRFVDKGQYEELRYRSIWSIPALKGSMNPSFYCCNKPAYLYERITGEKVYFMKLAGWLLPISTDIVKFLFFGGYCCVTEKYSCITFIIFIIETRIGLSGIFIIFLGWVVIFYKSVWKSCIILTVLPDPL